MNPVSPDSNTVRVVALSGQHGNLGPDADNANLFEHIAIPPAIGRLHTTLPRGTLARALGEAVSLLAIIIVAIEEDAASLPVF